jgi:hypothetical protein
MLGRLRMSIDECLQEYPLIAKEAFGKKKNIFQRIASGAKYDETPLVQEMERLVGSRTHEKDPRDKPSIGQYQYDRYPSPGDLCKT